MCDYSLHAVATRPAKAGEALVTTTFRGTSTKGFASVDEPEVAVCLLPSPITSNTTAGGSGRGGRFFGSASSARSTGTFLISTTTRSNSRTAATCW